MFAEKLFEKLFLSIVFGATRRSLSFDERNLRDDQKQKSEIKTFVVDSKSSVRFSSRKREENRRFVSSFVWRTEFFWFWKKFRKRTKFARRKFRSNFVKRFPRNWNDAFVIVSDSFSTRRTTMTEAKSVSFVERLNTSRPSKTFDSE